MHCHKETPPPETDTWQIVSFAYGKEILSKPADNLQGRLFSVGIHPWYLPSEEKNWLEDLHRYAKRDDVRAIGECGYDKLATHSLKEQATYFEPQLALAYELGKPAVLHIVRAWDALFASIKRVRNLPPMIVHGFRGKLELAEMLLSKGFYLSLGRYYHQSVLEKLFHTRRLFLESDDLATFAIKEHYQQVATLLAISDQILRNAIFETAQSVGLFPSTPKAKEPLESY